MNPPLIKTDQRFNQSIDESMQEEPADLESAYVAAVEELSVGDFDSEAPRAYNRSFAAKAERQEGDTSGAQGGFGVGGAGRRRGG